MRGIMIIIFAILCVMAAIKLGVPEAILITIFILIPAYLFIEVSFNDKKDDKDQYS